MRYRIGVDVGGTNTDAILLSLDAEAGNGVVSTFKYPTTSDITSGIQKCVENVMCQANVRADEIVGVMIGTTHFINAVISSDRSVLSPVAVLRLGYPYTLECPPFIDFPTSLRSIVEGGWCLISGGRQIDGSEIGAINEAEVRQECKKLVSTGISVIVIVGIYSPLEKDGQSQEDHVRRIILEDLGPGIDVICSREVGKVGLLERENAAILNGSILRFARKTIQSFHRAISTLGLACPLYLTQNDGTLISASTAARLPIRTFASGATNSMRGASYLAGLGTKDGLNSDGKSVIVVDIGGTSTDVGVLLPTGFPRQAAAFIQVGGVRTNFSMPDVQSIGLGGGSFVEFGHNDGVLSAHIGPRSVGLNLSRDAIVFGGSVTTATDIIVASDPNTLQIGDPAKVRNRFSHEELEASRSKIKRMLESIIDRMKVSPEPCKVLLVGGGSIIAPQKLNGVEELIRPPFFSCANAVGAAVALISAEVDTIEILENRSLEEVIRTLEKDAIEKVIEAGAKMKTVKVVEVENLPVQYVTNKATRIIIRAVGELDDRYFGQQTQNSAQYLDQVADDLGANSLHREPGYTSPFVFPQEVVDMTAYRPNVTKGGVWYLSELDLEWIQEGCGILGAGGGGSPFPPFLMAREILRGGETIRVIDPETLPDDAVVFRGSFMGSPSVSNERLQSGNEMQTAVHELMRYMHISEGAAIISEEIGGGNGIQPMILASAKHLNLPVFDGDLMGRAYPRMEQSLPAAFNIPNSLTPCAISDGVNNSVVLPSTSDKQHVEAILRNICTTLGSKVGVSMAPLSAKICREFGVTHTVSQAWRLGRAVAQCRKENNIKGVSSAILNVQNGAHIFTGKIAEIQREVRAGFTWGVVRITPLLIEEQDTVVVEGNTQPSGDLKITFQNEFLVAMLEEATGPAECVAVVPDLITVLDSQSGSSLGTHELRYGLRVTCIALAGHSNWGTPEGLACGGPAAFGLDEALWSPVGVYKEPRSVISEYSDNLL